MKKWIKLELAVVLFAALIGLVESCKEKADIKESMAIASDVPETKILDKKSVSEDFKKYWYAGEAELNSYELNQARYGEIREGTAMLVYVTEPFLKDKQVKADNQSASNIPVLKLNSTKNYLTGIYPYSIMSSSFYPVHDNQHALKVTFSCQEWCGQVYAQLNNKSNFEIQSHSYFESEGDQELELEKTVLENELWNKIRIDPNNLPLGSMKVLPSMEYIRLSHKELKSYDAILTLMDNGALKTYKIEYPGLNRTLEINFVTEFPHTIESWSDTFVSGYGSNAKKLVSTATKIKTLKSPYWRQGSNKFLNMRDSLGL
jgi:hypothetical protein